MGRYFSSFFKLNIYFLYKKIFYTNTEGRDKERVFMDEAVAAILNILHEYSIMDQPSIKQIRMFYTTLSYINNTYPILSYTILIYTGGEQEPEEKKDEKQQQQQTDIAVDEETIDFDQIFSLDSDDDNQMHDKEESITSIASSMKIFMKDIITKQLERISHDSLWTSILISPRYVMHLYDCFVNKKKIFIYIQNKIVSIIRRMYYIRS